MIRKVYEVDLYRRQAAGAALSNPLDDLPLIVTK
jgi:hypothetical protein